MAFNETRKLSMAWITISQITNRLQISQILQISQNIKYHRLQISLKIFTLLMEDKMAAGVNWVH